MKRLANGLLLVAAALLAFWLGDLRGHAAGGTAERRAAEQREQSINAQQAAALALENQRHRATEAALRSDAASAVQSFNATLAHEQAQHDRLVAGLRSGAVRVSVAVVPSSAACAGGTGGDPAAATGAGHKARAELAPAAAADLDTIASDGNAAILQLNAVIDRYNAVRDRLNTPATHAQAQ